MGMYKIKNLTDSFGKRDADYNKVVSFQISNGLMKKTITIDPGNELYIELKMLPLDLQRLRIKKVISVTEIGNLEYNLKLRTQQAKNKPAIIKEDKLEVIDNTSTVGEIIEDTKTNKIKKDKNS